MFDSQRLRAHARTSLEVSSGRKNQHGQAVLGRAVILFLLLSSVFLLSDIAWSAERPSRLFARYEKGGKVSYGIVEGNVIRRIEGDLFGDWKSTDEKTTLESVTLLVPTKATQVFAMAGNYYSHLKGKTLAANFQMPQPFFKSVASLQRHEGNIELPPNSAPVNYEAEMVIVIGKKCKNVPKEKAMNYVLGVTCGNDVSGRAWQKKDVQWWRAKGTDTFGPCGPFIATGLNYDDLLVKLRLNGEVVQEERTSMMIHDVASTVSYISQNITMQPGDLIFTGTSGTPAAIKPGDEVEVEIEGIGILRNFVVAEQ